MCNHKKVFFRTDARKPHRHRSSNSSLEIGEKSTLIKFDPFWTDLIKKIKNKTAIFILSVNVTNFYRNIFRLVRKSSLIQFDPFWTDLLQKNQKQKSHFYPFCKCDKFL